MSTELGKTGLAIWQAYRADGLDAGAQAMVRELARCADTLDRLDGLASGRQDRWVLLAFDEMGEIHLSVDKILDERRNHQLALKALYGELRMSGIKPQTMSGGASKDEEPVDMLEALRRAKANRERQPG
jgi:hypothetical protein